MSRKGRRLETRATEAQGTKPVPERRYRPLSTKATPKADFTDESQYRHVRGELVRIGLLALCLFATLILLRVITSMLGLLP